MMDLTTTLIGIGLIVLTIAPFVYFHLLQKNKRKKFVEEFMLLAGQEQVKVSQYDVWSSYFALGIDTGAKKLFYYKKRGDKLQRELINLAEVDKCRVNNVKKALNEDQVIDRLELVFAFRNSKLPEKTIEFFSKEEFMTLNGELQLVEKWRGIVSTNLEVKKSLSMAS